MAIHLTTGVPGAGKTLYTVSQVLLPLCDAPIDINGSMVNRRLMIGGIPDLLIEHEIIEVPQVNQDEYKDEWTAYAREPGTPPLDVPNRADNWWLWCRPGDVIVIDEAQRLFRPFAAGRRVPQFIAKLETHRHYGVDFYIITQHPQLIHTNVRNLVGVHRHVRRMFGGMSTVIYEWDHCTHPDRTKNASVNYWRHDKNAFKLYKSSQLHTKTKTAFPVVLVVLVLAVLVAGFLGWRFYSQRLNVQTTVAPAAPGASNPLPASAPPPAVLASATRALFLGQHPPPPGPADLVQLPDHIAGCYDLDGSCKCVTSPPARVVDGHARFCRAVLAGLYVPSPSRIAAAAAAAAALAERSGAALAPSAFLVASPPAIPASGSIP